MVTGYEVQMYGDIHLIRMALEKIAKIMEEEHAEKKAERDDHRLLADRRGSFDPRTAP